MLQSTILVVHFILFLDPEKTLGRVFETTPKPEPVTMSPKEIAHILANETSFRKYQFQRYSLNQHWFRQLGRPCNSSISLDNLYLTDHKIRTKLPNDTELIEIARGFCFGSASPTASIDILACSPTSGTCDCYADNATWDPDDLICRMLPGGFCLEKGNAEVACVRGAKCIEDQCVCPEGRECLDHKVKIPDPGPAGDPTTFIIPYPLEGDTTTTTESPNENTTVPKTRFTTPRYVYITGGPEMPLREWLWE